MKHPRKFEKKVPNINCVEKVLSHALVIPYLVKVPKNPTIVIPISFVIVLIIIFINYADKS